MKSITALLPTLTFIAAAWFSATAYADHFDDLADRLDRAVHLSDAQKRDILSILRQESADVRKIPSAERFPKAFEIHQAARAQIKALLSPEQLKVYNITPQTEGGGLMLMPPNDRVDQLNAVVTLTSAQKDVARQIFQEEVEALMALPDKDRAMKGSDYRLAAIREIRAMLTPEQRAKYDQTPQRFGGAQGSPVLND